MDGTSKALYLLSRIFKANSMNKPTQPDKKSMEEKIEEILEHYTNNVYYEGDPMRDTERVDQKEAIKRLSNLFTESLKGQKKEILGKAIKDIKAWELPSGFGSATGGIAISGVIRYLEEAIKEK